MSYHHKNGSLEFLELTAHQRARNFKNWTSQDNAGAAC